jgi:hypothetical protein
MAPMSSMYFSNDGSGQLITYLYLVVEVSALFGFNPLLNFKNMPLELGSSPQNFTLAYRSSIFGPYP